LPKKGRTMASARSASVNGGLEAKPLEAESFFVNFHTKSGQKLRISMKICPVSEADCFAQPRPALNFGKWGEGAWPPIAGSGTEMK